MEEVWNMRFGLCTSLDNIQKVENMGYDYIEPSVTGIVSMSEDEFHQVVQLVKKSRIKCESFNILFPSDIRLTGDQFNEEVFRTYLDHAMNRVTQLGGQTIVLGSGGSRRIPEGFDLQEGRAQLLRAVCIVGDIAASYKLTIAIEPLNTKETNIITTVKEGIEFVSELNHPNVKLLADFYHMRMENEPMEILERAGALLHHLHIANSNGRTYLLSPDEDIYVDFFNAIHNAGYNGRISVEGRALDLEKDGPITLSVLKALQANYA